MAYIDPQLMDILSTGGKFPKLYRYALSFKGIVIKATYHNDYNFVRTSEHVQSVRTVKSVS